MFENERTSSNDAWSRMEDPPESGEAPEQHQLDSEDAKAIHRRLLARFQQELDRQYDNRIQMAIDEDYYDHIQFSEQDRLELEDRGQAATVYNVAAQALNWVIGSEKRGRADFKVLPRRKEDGTSAERKTSILKYLSDANKTPYHRSRAFADSVKVGIGWVEDGIQESDDGEPIYSRYENWRNMLWDSACSEPDLSDCRYVIRHKWLDVDVAEALAPDRADVIALSKEDGARFGYDGEYADEVMDQKEAELEHSAGVRSTTFDYRDRVRVIEMWFRKPERVNRIIRGDFAGAVVDDEAPHPVLLEAIRKGELVGRPVVAERTMMRMYCAVMTIKGLLWLGPSPYRHNQYPFTPIWGHRRGRDGLPYGMMRGLRDIQDDVNKRMSKTLFILSSNKIVMDEGAVEDEEELRDEAARPDAVIKKKKGYELSLNVEKELAPAHLDIMSRNIAMIQQTSGVTDELMGRTTNATSGVAVQARQEQGSMATSNFFDNLMFAFEVQGAKQVSLVEQFMTEEKQFRITNQRGTPEYITVNDGMPENDIVRQQADFVISRTEWRATMRQAQAEQLMEQLNRMSPDVAMVLLDLVIELMDLPNQDELVSRIRQLNGQSDPDADPESPEEQERQRQKNAQAAMQQAMLEADLRSRMAKAGRDEAEIEKSRAQIKKIASEIARQNVDSQASAIDAAIKAILNPAAAPVADTLLQESSFVSRTEQEVAAEQQRAAQQEQQLQQQQQGAAPTE